MRQARGTSIGTSDSLTSLYFLKMRQDVPYQILEMIFGGTNRRTLHSWFHMVIDYIYCHSPILIRSRNLSNPNHMMALLEELHGATMRNTRCASTFLPTMLEFIRQNPLLGWMKLVVMSWDSRHILTPHSMDFDEQKRSWSTKVSDNAIVKLACSGMDSIQKFVYMCSASISPANTDEALASFLIDLEGNQGKY